MDLFPDETATFRQVPSLCNLGNLGSVRLTGRMGLQRRQQTSSLPMLTVEKCLPMSQALPATQPNRSRGVPAARVYRIVAKSGVVFFRPKGPAIQIAWPSGPGKLHQNAPSGPTGNAVKGFLEQNRAIQPGTGFTTKPGVAALRRTPGTEIQIAPNPNGVPQRFMPGRMNRICDVEPRRGSKVFVPFFLGCAVVTATPGFVVKPRWG